VITKEFKHEPEALDLRGGTTTGDHVDILGAWGVNDNVLRIAAGAGDEIEDYFVSSLPEYAKKIYWDHPPPGHQQQMLVN
jgi:phospholipid:diacylglycerol acyltransferase